MKAALRNNILNILSSPKKLFVLYAVDAAFWVAVGAGVCYTAITFGGV